MIFFFSPLFPTHLDPTLTLINHSSRTTMEQRPTVVVYVPGTKQHETFIIWRTPGKPIAVTRLSDKVMERMAEEYQVDLTDTHVLVVVNGRQWTADTLELQDGDTVALIFRESTRDFTVTVETHEGILPLYFKVEARPTVMDIKRSLAMSLRIKPEQQILFHKKNSTGRNMPLNDKEVIAADIKLCLVRRRTVRKRHKIRTTTRRKTN